LIHTTNNYAVLYFSKALNWFIWNDNIEVTMVQQWQFLYFRIVEKLRLCMNVVAIFDGKGTKLEMQV
jgi:hypothetical protein